MYRLGFYDMTCDLCFSFPLNQSVIYGVTCIEQVLHECFSGRVEYSVKRFEHLSIEIRAVFLSTISCSDLFDTLNSCFERLGVAVRCVRIVCDGMVYTLVSA